MAKRILYYVNQFFGQIGGEEEAGIPPSFSDKAIGPAAAFADLVKGQAEVTGTIVCGDNYFNEKTPDALSFILGKVKELAPDLVVAGPAFNAGRYGMACAGIANAVAGEMNIPVVTGMYEENPGADACKSSAIVVLTGNSASAMKSSLPKMAGIAVKILAGDPLGTPQEEGYLPQGRRLTVFSDKRGSQRAAEMLVKRLKGEEFTTELPMPVFDRVTPQAPIKDMTRAKIALVSSGGIVPFGNPGRLESASAQKYLEFDITGLSELTGKYMTVHGGYDPVYANEKPDRVAPLDILKKFEREGIIKEVHSKFYATTGTGTSVGKAIEFGKAVGRKLKEEGVDGVILTST